MRPVRQSGRGLSACARNWASAIPISFRPAGLSAERHCWRWACPLDTGRP